MGGRGGGWLNSAALHCVRPLAFQRNQKFWPLKSGFEFDSTVESRRLYTARFYSHLNDQLMLGSFNLRCNTRNVGPFREEGCIVQTLQQNGLTLVAWLFRFKETYINWMDLRTPFLHSAVGYALRADEHKDETGSTGC